MSDQTRELQILIKYGLDDAKAKVALAEMQQIKDATVAGGKATEQAGKQTSEFTKELTKAFNAKSSFKKVLSEVSAMLPGFGQALRFVFNPAVALILLAVKAVSSFREELAKADEMLKEMAKTEEDLHQRNLEAYRSEHEARIAGFAAYYHDLLRIIHLQDSAEEQSKDRIEQIKQETEAQKQLVKQKEATALAELDEQLASNQISKSEHSIRKGQIEQGAASAAQSLDVQQAQAEIQESKKLLAALEQENMERVKRLGILEAEKAKADDHNRARKDEIENIKTMIPRLQEKAKGPGLWATMKSAFSGPTTLMLMQDAEAAEKQVEALQARLAELQRPDDRSTQLGAVRQQEISRIKGEITTGEGRISELNRSLPDKAAGSARGNLLGASNAADLVLSGHASEMSQGQSRQLAELMQFFGATKQNSDLVLKMIAGANDSQSQFMAALDALATRQEAIKRELMNRINGLRATTSNQ